MTTQNTDIKASLRIGRMYNAAGEIHHFELAVMNRTTHYVVSLEIFKGAHIMANRISNTERTALSLESARKMWKEFQASVTGAYAVVSHETQTKVLGQEYVDTKWEAAPAGGARDIAVLFHDGNEGHYVVTVDYPTLTVQYGGTRCPDIPADTTKEIYTSRPAVEVAFQAKLAETRKGWIEQRVAVTHNNFVCQLSRPEEWR